VCLRWLPFLAPRGSLGRERATPCQPRSRTLPCPWRLTAVSSRPRSSANTPRPTVTAPGSFDELAVDEGRPGADERDQVGCVDHAPAALGTLRGRRAEMAHKKGASSSRNGRDSNAQRLVPLCTTWPHGHGSSFRFRATPMPLSAEDSHRGLSPDRCAAPLGAGASRSQARRSANVAGACGADEQDRPR
jgi:hypothetical protein